MKEVFIKTNSHFGTDPIGLKESLRNEFVYPAIAMMVVSEHFPEVTVESSRKQNGKYKVTILNKAAGKQHPYFPYESTALKALSLGISLVEDGEARPYNVVRDEINSHKASGVVDDIWDKLRRSLDTAALDMQEACNHDTTSAIHTFEMVLHEYIDGAILRRDK
jgi:hypothetical protein